ncbi:MAG: diacylglycerol/lipid kinase family protein [Bacteroidales bacterium]
MTKLWPTGASDSASCAERQQFHGPHFVVNARAMAGLRAPRMADVRGEALRRFPDARWTVTSRSGDAAVIAHAAAIDGAGMVVAVGGDGTINEVVNGLMQVPGIERPPLGIVPAGSGSDFIRSINVPRDATAALAVLEVGHAIPVDVGEIHCEPSVHRYFMNMAGCGASGRVVERFNKRRVPGTLGYVVASGLTAIGYRFPIVDLALDGGPADRVLLNLLFVCNGEYCGGGMHAGMGARVDDGLLQIVSVSGVGRIGSALQWPSLYTGHLERVRGARVQAGRTLRVTSPEEEVLVDCDGELCGRLPATYGVVPAALRICVPAPAGA